MPPSVRTMEIAPGEAGIFQSLTAMRAGVLKEVFDPAVRQCAAELAASCRPTDTLCKTDAVFQFVKARMDYEPDPDDVEAVGLASFHLQNIKTFGGTSGDCDDAAVLVATLLRSLGIKARFAVASFRADKELHHVWTEAMVAPDSWVNLDTFRSERLNAEPTRIVYRDI